MKLPKITKRYCPKCKKATEQKIEFYKSGGKRSSFSYGSIERAKTFSSFTMTVVFKK